MNNITMLILSCDKFSDLWDGHIKLLESNWPDRSMETIIVTDAPTTKRFPNIQILSAGTDTEWSDRLAFALKQVKTKYVFITLDDYYLLNRVNNKAIYDLIETLETRNFSYVRLYKRPKRATSKPIPGCKGLYSINLDVKYSVNLYSGIWKKDFLEYVVAEPLNAWRFEVSLTDKARKYGAKCIVSYREEFQILDVVRKGKILHKAETYFRHNPGIYEGNRELQSRNYELKLGFQTFVARYTPLWMHKYIKAFMRKRGKQFFSDEAE